MSENRVVFPGGAVATTEVEYFVQDRYVNKEGAQWRYSGYGPYTGEGGEQAVRDVVQMCNAEEAENYAADDPVRSEYRAMKKTIVTTVEPLS